MSGGRFDYNQYHIKDIADRIEEEIKRATMKRPPTITKSAVSVMEVIEGEHSTRYISRDWDMFKNLKEARKNYLDLGYKIKDIDDKSFWAIFLTHEKDEVKYKVSYSEWEEYSDGGYYPDYTKETLKELKKAVKTLRKAYIYAQRVDWLLSGDDGEESFHERLKEDLKKL